MIKYMLIKHSCEIKKIDVIRETEKMIIVKGWSGCERREAKESDYCKWFDSLEEAKMFAVASLKNKLSVLNRQISDINTKLIAVEKITEID